MLQSLPSLAMAAVLLVGGYSVIHGSLSLGVVLRGQRLPAAARSCRCAASACGSASTSARSPRASASSRCSTSSRDIVERPGADAAARRPGRAPLRGGRRSATSPAGRCCAASTSTSPPGATVALIGPTGCGKTTLTALIPRFYDVAAGRVTVDGADVRDVTLGSLRAEVGIVSQDTFLFSTTSPRTSPTARPRRPTRRSCAPPARPRRTSSSATCPTATTRASASAA